MGGRGGVMGVRNVSCGVGWISPLKSLIVFIVGGTSRSINMIICNNDVVVDNRGNNNEYKKLVNGRYLQ